MKTFTLVSARDDCLLSFMSSVQVLHESCQHDILIKCNPRTVSCFCMCVYSWRIGLLSMEIRIKEQNMQSGVCYHLGIRVNWVDHPCCSQWLFRSLDKEGHPGTWQSVSGAVSLEWTRREITRSGMCLIAPDCPRLVNGEIVNPHIEHHVLLHKTIPCVNMER